MTSRPFADLSQGLKTSYQVSLLHVAPPTAIFLAKSPLVAGYDTSSVHTIFSGGAPLSEEIGQTVKKRLNARSVRQGYGMTEASPGILIGLPASQQYGSVGVVMSNTEVKVSREGRRGKRG